jgi:hypothetical protein
MLKKIAFIVLISYFAVSCGSTSSSNQTANNSLSKYKEPKIVGKIESKEITESSGIVDSRCQKAVLWTHNDSGGDAFIFAIDEKGKQLGTWKISDAKNTDWEDIATFQDANGNCFLYIGDTGNNKRTRTELTIYKVKEPKVSDSIENSSKKNPNKTDSAEAIKFSYPDNNYDAETLLVHPKTQEIYVLTKNTFEASGVFKIGNDGKAKKIADFSVPSIPSGFLTGGEISPDGTKVIICDYFNGYEITLPKTAKNFDEIWKQEPNIIELGERKQGEAISYSSDGNSIFATSEKKDSPLIKVEKK